MSSGAVLFSIILKLYLSYVCMTKTSVDWIVKSTKKPVAIALGMRMVNSKTCLLCLEKSNIESNRP